MKRQLLSHLIACGALVASALPAFAVPVGSGTFGFATNGVLAVADFGRVTGEGGFSDNYDFTLTSPASLQSAGVQGSPYSSLLLTLQAISGGASFNLLTQDNSSTDGGRFSSESAANLTTGVYRLLITGAGTNALSQYAGQLRLSFAVPSAVPLPGALVLMGTVLAGGAGFGAMRKRAKKASALQAA